ncbi:DNA ligase [Paradesulfitobacterium ferrireducens]|uniref:DNA ligase n=1 Tax=Paradesulfitobacterium ferrireducens TaxID=2816476 RepID=UPI001A8D70D8|nr:DNA ligase [Paradesulfitobacterium ferrireducens]
MSKMSELSLAVTELKRCGEALISISESLAGWFSGDENDRIADQSKAEAPGPEEKPLTLEAVRAVLAEKSRAGHTAEVRALLEKHGAAKLSEINPAEYPALLAEAEVLGNG